MALAPSVHAQESGRQIEAIQTQINQLQQELKRIRTDLAMRDRQVKAAQADAAQARALAQRSAGPAVATNDRARLAVPSGTAQASGSQGFAYPAGGVQEPASTPPNPLGPSGQTVATSSADSLGKGQFRLGGVTVTLGGFIAAEGVYRTRNDVADIVSNFNTIPTANNPNYHTGEFRGSARATRLSALAEASVSKDEKLSGYVESDFLGVGTTSNSVETNSYVPRLRQAYLGYDNSALGIHVLAGQAWTLMTMNKVGITPRQEDIPLTIDLQYVPGFQWKRQWQVRADKDLFDNKLVIGASFEEPQTVYYTGPNGLGVTSGTATITNPGGSALNSTSTYSNDIAPDLIVKAAADPGWGHYEAFGIGRLIHDRVSFTGAGHNNTVVAGGAGGGFILPLIPKMLDFRLSGIAGYGIGSYGSGQLPDAIVTPFGSPKALAEYQILAGLVGHPVPTVDLYSYVGTEQISRSSFVSGGKPFGYGNPLYSNAGCNTESAAASTCVGNTSGLTQGTLGTWWRFLQGNFGTVQSGVQYSYTRRSIFSGAGSTPGKTVSPSTDDNMVLFSVRYLPFQ